MADKALHLAGVQAKEDEKVGEGLSAGIHRGNPGLSQRVKGGRS
jgi:hypothetical protein